ncbi:hypothetical protein FACS1894103_4970 [Campylobacterota bacterium]|nr:hypothetical protein FACS1894103_4970 [Campylobacterota bacterium]
MNKIVALALAIFLIGCSSSGGNNGETDYIHALFPELPPDPGKAGKATLEGIDSNKNGVRDDVEIEIYKYARVLPILH